MFGRKSQTQSDPKDKAAESQNAPESSNQDKPAATQGFVPVGTETPEFKPSSGSGTFTPSTEAVSAPPLKPYAKRGTQMAQPTTPTASGRSMPSPYKQPDLPRRVVDIPGSPVNRRGMMDPQKDADPASKTLTVGREIRLNGEISACDRLIVEGTVEANLSDATAIEVSETGLFKGRAEIDEAIISGRFEGELVARKRLTIHTGALITGTVRYAAMVVEEGGRVKGTVSPLDDDEPQTA